MACIAQRRADAVGVPCALFCSALAVALAEVLLANGLTAQSQLGNVHLLQMYGYNLPKVCAPRPRCRKAPIGCA